MTDKALSLIRFMFLPILLFSFILVVVIFINNKESERKEYLKNVKVCADSCFPKKYEWDHTVQLCYCNE